MPSRRFSLSSRALRFFVVALALLQLVAPTWHICAMGGHVAGHSAGHSAGHGANHDSASGSGAAILAALAESPAQANRPLICVCAPHEKPQTPPDPRAPRFEGRADASHATCLAMLLQTMPAQLGAPPRLPRSQSLVVAAFVASFYGAPSVAAPRRFLGRAPPRKC